MTDKLYRVICRWTGSLQPSGTFWNKEVLYCGYDRAAARQAYHQSAPSDFYGGYGNRVVDTISEAIDDFESDDFNEDCVQQL